MVSIKNYVGLIQMKNGFQIQVLPKISFGEEDEGNVQTKRVFLRMLRSMKDFPSKGHYLFMEPRSQFAPRSDIVMKKREHTVILDTKWKSIK